MKRPTFCRSAAFLPLLLFLMLSSSGAQSDTIDHGWYQKIAKMVLKNARREIEPVLSQNELRIAKSIKYRVTSSPNVGAFAFREDGRRKIVITAGMIVVLEWISQGWIVANEKGYMDCLEEYLYYLGDRLVSNSQRLAQGQSPKLTTSMFQYAKTNAGNCHGLRGSEFLAIPDVGNINADFMESSIMFLYLHELAHHVLDHIDNLDRRIDKIRAREAEADLWAMKTAMKAGYSIYQAFPLYSFIGLIGGNSLEAEEFASHPLGVRRILEIYDGVVTHYERNPQELLSNMSEDNYQSFLSILRETRRHLQSILDTL